jgi:hypothetical protein
LEGPRMIIFKPVQFIIVLLGTLLFCNSFDNSELDRRKAEAIYFAVIHSNANKAKNWDDGYWDIVATFMDIQEYNNLMDLNRTPENKIVTPEDTWFWDDRSSLDQFKKTRDEINNK